VAAGWAEDVRLIREQVRRCQEILQQMAVEVGNGVGEVAAEVAATDLVAGLGDGAWGAVPVVVRVDPGSAQRPVRVPLRALKQVLHNLVKNAVQASPPGKPVEVQLSERGGAVCIEVRDQGPGMSPEILARAGEPFFTTKAPGEGIGLGLFLARSVLAQSGGRLDLESAPGKGTVARIVLPGSDGTRAATHRRDDSALSEKGSHDRRKAL
jgi:two-component system sensor histidine kinase RegB